MTGVNGVNKETTDKAMSGVGDKAMSGRGDEAMTPEPSTELLREPSPYGCDEGITPMGERLKEEEGGREGQEVREEEIALTPSDSPSSFAPESPGFPAPTWKACFRFAREDFPGEDGEKHVGGAWKRGDAVEDVWEKLTEAKETGESLGRIFWQPGE
jgi:hypothetical protein